MAKILTPPEALHRAAALCSSAEHCTADIREKLARWGVTEADSCTIIDRLVQERFIDEQRYAVAFVKDKFRFSGRGRIKMRYALQQKRTTPSPPSTRSSTTTVCSNCCKPNRARFATTTPKPDGPNSSASPPPGDSNQHLFSTH